MAEAPDSDEGRSEIERYFSEGGVEGAARPYAVEHLDAGHPVRERRRALRDLAAADAEKPRGIANVGIFGEGTDSPSLDAVGRCCTARSKSLTSLCRLQSHPAQYVSGIPSAAILLSISHPIRCSTRCLANVRARISGPMIAL